MTYTLVIPKEKNKDKLVGFCVGLLRFGFEIDGIFENDIKETSTGKTIENGECFTIDLKGSSELFNRFCKKTKFSMVAGKYLM